MLFTKKDLRCTEVDAVDVVVAFGVRCPAAQEATKIMLSLGDFDYAERNIELLSKAKEMIERSIQFEAEKARKLDSFMTEKMRSPIEILHGGVVDSSDVVCGKI